MSLSQKMGREEHVVESVSAKDDLIASGELIDGLKNLVPGVLRHEADERVQTDDSLLIKVVKNGRRKSSGVITLTIAPDEHPALIQAVHC